MKKVTAFLFIAVVIEATLFFRAPSATVEAEKFVDAKTAWLETKFAPFVGPGGKPEKVPHVPVKYPKVGLQPKGTRG